MEKMPSTPPSQGVVLPNTPLNKFLNKFFKRAACGDADVAAWLIPSLARAGRSRSLRAA
jgi:hypothetical protein